MMSRAYDLAVIGSGGAGFAAAIAGAERGARVALIGEGALGGTCVNVGCVPSKRLLRAAEAVHAARAAGRFAGLRGSAQVEDWSAVVGEKDALVRDLRQSKYAGVLEHYPSITALEGHARFSGRGLLLNGEPLDAGKIVIATGARPAVPLLPGLESVPALTSTGALELSELPDSMIVLGGGYIGCELAQLFARAGVQVTLLARSRLLSRSEPEISRALADCFRQEGIVVREGLSCRGVEQTEGSMALQVETERSLETLTAERLLLATGRTPNSDSLDLERAGIACDAAGHIAVDDFMRTSRQGVYAAGDVTGRDLFVYMAAHGGKIAARNALEGDRQRYDALGLPTVDFTDPQAASAGMTEAQAQAAGLAVRSVVFSLDHLPRALAAKTTHGLIKLVAEAGSGRLLGAHILASEGGDSIQTATLAIRHGMTVQTLGEMVFPYLTTVEGLKLAAQAFDKDPSMLSCCAG